MKTLSTVVKLALVAALIITTTACSKKSKPGTAAKMYVTHFYQKDYDKFVAGLVFEDDSIPGRREKNVKAMEVFLEEKGPHYPMDSVSKINIITEEFSDDKETAKVSLETVLKNGKADTTIYTMIESGNEWKISSEK